MAGNDSTAQGKSRTEAFDFVALEEFLSKLGRPFLRGKFGDAKLIIAPDETLKPKSDLGQLVEMADRRLAFLA